MTVKIFSGGEKRELAGQGFRALVLDLVDFSGADLRGARFETVSLRGCDFRRADLRGAAFIDCDLREACLVEIDLGENDFTGSWLAGATGLTVEQTRYVFGRGGLFVAVGEPPTAGLNGR
jgi:uncharacterized protein YjbI with pentapeptide repeats